MSTKTTNDTSLQSTKQMLDELDALMDKMLSLPVNDPDEAAPLQPEAAKPPMLTPTLSATLTLLEPPAPISRTLAPSNFFSVPEPLPQQQPHPAVNPPHMTLPAVEPEAPRMQQPAPQPEPLTNEVLPPSVLPRLEPLLEEIPEASAPMATQWGYLPLLWINLAFDQATLMLGAGTWLRGQIGRMLLGLSGIVMLVIAVAWFLKDWLGWN